MNVWRLLLPLGLVLVVLFCFRELPSLGYTGPDAARWVEASNIQTAEGREFIFEQEQFRGYRPLTALSYAIGRLVHGVSPMGYQVFDLALHVACVLFGYFVLRAFRLSRSAAFVGCIVLGLHPLTIEVVPVLARRGDLLGAFLQTLCILSVLRGHYLLVSASAALALLAKEPAFLLFPVVACVAWLEKPPNARKSVLLVLATTIVIVIARAFFGLISGYPDKEPPPLIALGADFWLGLSSPFSACLTPGIGIGAHRGVVLSMLLLALTLIVPAIASVGIVTSCKGSVARRTMTVGAFWLALQCLLYVFTRKLEFRVLYPSLLPLSLLIAAAWEARVTMRFGLRLVNGLFLCAFFFLLVFEGPVRQGVGEWKEASALQARILESAQEAVRSHPKAPLLLVVNQPEGVWLGLAHRQPNWRSSEFASRESYTPVLGDTGLEAILRLRGFQGRAGPINQVVVTRMGARIRARIEDGGKKIVQFKGDYWSLAHRAWTGRADGGLSESVMVEPPFALPEETRVLLFDLEESQVITFESRLELTFVSEQ